MIRPAASYGQATAGHAVAILHIGSRHALFPGNVQCAATFPFPVLYEEVAVDSLGDLFSGKAYIQTRLLAACERAIAKGAGVTVGAARG